MNKIISAAAFILICSSTFGQFNQGRILAGGSVSFSATTGKSEVNGTTTTNGRSTDFTFAPNGGYFIMNNLAVGAALSLTLGSFKADGSDVKTNETTAQILPFVRYYLDPGIFFQLMAGGGSYTRKSKNPTLSTTNKFSIFTWSIGAGYAYFLNDYVAIEPILSYSSYAIKSKQTKNRDISSGIAFALALQVYLGARN